MASIGPSQTNGILPAASAPSSQIQPQPQTQPTQTISASSSATMSNTQSIAAAPAAAGPSSPTAAAHEPRPRDARTIELLLTSQGVTSFDARVPLLLLDFAYRHTSSILNDALHLSGDPYTTHAGAKPSGSSGAVPTAPPGGDATVNTNAINIAIACRQAYQFRGGSGGGMGGGMGGGGVSKEWLQELARERNKVALPRVLANEWGVRLPNERFVLSGQSWGLQEDWVGEGELGSEVDDDEGEGDGDGDDDGDGDAMEGVEGPAHPDDEGEGENDDGGLEQFLGDDLGDEEMEGME
ncbi:transcription initiation factor IID, 31kD subunit-domain-containing protein [Xylaria sp. CBS 124048]|nr:transcription initiation factor IID, 31kD subunit-domain-containing protein [Xylaria sp. CBS 124048]